MEGHRPDPEGEQDKAMTNVRFTAWISRGERDAIERAAEKESTSANFIVRQAIREYLQITANPQHLFHVTNENSNEGAK